MEQQTQKKFPAWPFIGGMAVVGGIWLVTSGLTPLMYEKSSYSSGSYGSSGYVSDSASWAPSLSNSGKSLNVVGNNQERTVTNNYLSVHVKAVSAFQKDLGTYVKGLGGKVMKENVTVASDDQSESGTFVVLVPNKEAENFFKKVEEQSIKIVDRQVISYQITQEYNDIERELARYELTYSKIMTYYNKATSVSDLINLQNQLDQVQNQIDSLKGRKGALDELSSNTQYTIYSSTNEYNLPYVPQGTFEIAKTFKLAVRSLIGVTDGIVKLAIYVLVFSPIIALVSAGIYYTRKLLGKKSL